MPGRVHAPVRSVVTGGPGTGKSTLLEELARRGIATETEVARAILQAPGGMALRARDPAGFARAMFEAELAAWHGAQRRDGPTVFDRGFPDIAGFLALEGLPVPPEIADACRDLRYDGPVFRAPPWQAIYRPDAQRIQDWDAALASDAAVTAAWRTYRYEPIDLPLADVSDRADFVLARL
ncbi:AAA family ATPase [Pelagerythrobacter sp.]|uniref:AAA family ATPase n=1 Tax=Pelagerythrobacter sp. TaxID=2800702 RepID=UPI0035B2AD88